MINADINLNNHKRSLGNSGERFAQRVYLSKGFKIADTNVYNKRGKRFGEIDFVAVSAKEVVFVEVKTRKEENSKFGNIFESVNTNKIRKLVITVRWLLANDKAWQNLKPRIDVCAIIWPDIDKKPEKVIIRSNAIEDLF